MLSVLAATTPRTDLRHRSHLNRSSPADFSRSTPALRTPDPGRNRPFLPSVVFELSVRIPLSFLHQIFRAPGVQLIHRRDLREVQLARTSSRRRTKETTRAISLTPDPPPKRRNLLYFFVKIFGFGQITGETLSNFRQKSREVLKRSL
ncbi:hypothetical protein Prudu_021840 [Prunus dulcis]|uniref:Uncharacterized protein n=1 Tax=Prunus dulcis TaxID=3755 RepID=A0A4Y1S011_PRUDU|nr:hypothetical protein Prudu_021840 [Prunus dulcis]